MMRRLILLGIILTGVNLTMSCRVLIPREHRESTATWSGDTQLVEALSRYKARLSWNPLSQEMIVGPATTEILVYTMKPASLSLPEAKQIGKGPGRILPSGLVVSGTSVYYLVEEDGLRTLFVVDMKGGQPQSLLSGEILAISAAERTLAVFGLLSGRTVVWIAALDESGRLKAKLEGSYEVPGSSSTPLFRFMKDRLYVKSGSSVYLFDADGARGRAATFPACFYAIDVDKGLSPDGRLFSRSSDDEVRVIQADPFYPNSRMTDRIDDDRGC